MLSDHQLSHFRDFGYVLAPRLFSRGEARFYRDHYMRLRAQGPHPGDSIGVDNPDNDPLKKYPRLVHMQRWDETSLNWLIEPRLKRCLEALMEDEPLAIQSMVYFKPAGARGQALHQDQFYVRVKPGMVVGAWMALDPCDEENGCLRVVPGSHKLPILCHTKADTSVSFTDVAAPVPEHLKPEPAIMAPGDVLFFEGHLIHGSLPNRSRDRFRRALIGHYVSGDARRLTKFFQPLLKMDGTPVEMEGSEDGGPCGRWVDKDGRPEVEMIGQMARHGSGEEDGEK